MFKTTVVLILAIASQFGIANCEILAVPCTMSQFNQNCTISSLATLTLENYKFKPTTLYAKTVINFDITKSVVPVLTSDICAALPNILTFTAVGQGIEIIEDYAFVNCTMVTSIRIHFNNIHKLGKGIFSTTKVLQVLNIHGASLESTDMVELLSNLSEMVTLVLNANGLKEFPVEAIKNMKKLKYLYLYSNDLSDLDAEAFVENLPKLAAIYLNDNNFLCNRLLEIIKAFKANGTLVDTFTLSLYTKKRDYLPGKRYGIICLTEAQKQIENMKSALTMSLDELKNFPIGKAVIQLKDIVQFELVEADRSILELFHELNRTAGTNRQQNVSLNHVLAIWVVLILLMCTVVAVIIFVTRKLRFVHRDVPILSYENRSECLTHRVIDE